MKQLGSSRRFFPSLVGCWIILTTSDGLVRGRSFSTTDALQVNHHDKSSPPTFRKSGFRLPTTLAFLRGGEARGGGILRQRKGAGILDSETSQSGRVSRQPRPQNAVTTVIATTINNDDDADLGTRSRRNKTILIGMQSIIGVLALTMAVHYRSSWTPYFNKDFIQTKTLFLLRQLRNGEDAAHAPAPLRALVLYSMGLMVWEAAGLSTIPVETAAGMVFRYHEAAITSITGKLLGATLAFVAGRTILSSSLDKVKAISTSPLFVLLRSKNTHPPLLTAALMKFSILPELVKNLGCAVLPRIKLWMFIAVTLLHGGGFSLMWTWLGTSMRLQETTRVLRVTLSMGMFIGGVLTPLTMAWWMRALQAMSSSSSEETIQPNSSTMTVRQRMDAYLIRPTSLAEMWIGGLVAAFITAIALTRNVG